MYFVFFYSFILWKFPSVIKRLFSRVDFYERFRTFLVNKKRKRKSEGEEKSPQLTFLLNFITTISSSHLIFSYDLLL